MVPQKLRGRKGKKKNFGHHVLLPKIFDFENVNSITKRSRNNENYKQEKHHEIRALAQIERRLHQKQGWKAEKQY